MNGYKNEFLAGLEKLKKNITQFENDEAILEKPGDTNNSPANLAIHICGNLKHNIGAEIGRNGYVRKRDEEFTKTGLTKQKVIIEIESTIAVIEPILDKLTAEDLNKPFPSEIHGKGQTIGSVLTKIAMHMGYHLGQINYQRRIK